MTLKVTGSEFQMIFTWSKVWRDLIQNGETWCVGACATTLCLVYSQHYRSKVKMFKTCIFVQILLYKLNETMKDPDALTWKGLFCMPWLEVKNRQFWRWNDICKAKILSLTRTKMKILLDTNLAYRWEVMKTYALQTLTVMGQRSQAKCQI